MGRAALISLCLLAACSPPAQEQSAEDETAAVSSEPGQERFYGREQFTMSGTFTGAETGSFTEHVRDWGRTRAVIKDVRTASGREHTRVVYSGADIATIDLETGEVTLVTNPFYGDVVEAMRGRDGVAFGREIMQQMGANATGERGRFAGEACEYWEIPQLGSRSCVAVWGGTLYNRTELDADVVMERTVTELRMNDAGPDAAFAYDASAATRLPGAPGSPPR